MGDTIAATLPRSIFHRHYWELIDKTIPPSGFEQIVAAGQVMSKCERADGLFSHTVIQSFRCRDCGKLRIERTRTP